MSADAAGGLMVVWSFWIMISMYMIPIVFVVGLFSSKVSIWTGFRYSFNCALIAAIVSLFIVLQELLCSLS